MDTAAVLAAAVSKGSSSTLISAPPPPDADADTVVAIPDDADHAVIGFEAVRVVPGPGTHCRASHFNAVVPCS